MIKAYTNIIWIATSAISITSATGRQKLFLHSKIFFMENCLNLVFYRMCLILIVFERISSLILNSTNPPLDVLCSLQSGEKPSRQNWIEFLFRYG